jgi:hypothetical protein
MALFNEIRDIKSEPRDIRNFSFVVAVALLAIAFFYEPYYAVELALGALILAVVGIFVPRILFLPQKIWMVFGIVLGNLTSRIILIFFFYGVVTPLSYSAWLFSKRFLRDGTTNVQTYWVNREVSEPNRERYKQQF